MPTIRFYDDESFHQESAKSYLSELQQDAAGTEVPEQIRHDWGVVANWLGCKGGDLRAEHSDRFARAWNAYLAIGVAPSLKLQPSFDLFAEKLGHVPESDRAPTEIMNVFDRLLATDEEIRAKKRLTGS